MRVLVEDFFAQRRVAVVGVSRRKKYSPANLIYRKLRDAGYQAVPINPHSEVVEGSRCYPDLGAVPDGVDAVVVVTRPETTEEIVRQCAELGISRVWLHRSFGRGSVSPAAVNFCREHKMAVIPGGCPMMFCQPVDLGHRCLRWFLRMTGSLPK